MDLINDPRGTNGLSGRNLLAMALRFGRGDRMKALNRNGGLQLSKSHRCLTSREGDDRTKSFLSLDTHDTAFGEWYGG